MATERNKDIARLRQQDITFLAVGGLVLVLALTLSGALGILEGVSAAMLLAGGAAAYHLGVRANARRSHPVEQVAADRAEIGAVRQSRQALIDALEQPTLIVDAAGQLVAYNGDAAQIFNLPSMRRGLSAGSLRHPELLAGVDRVLANGGAMACELAPAREPDRTWLATISALGDNAVGERAALIVMTDQAPVKRAERARADFLANASHELRTPLTSISGFLETMRGPAKDDPDAWPRFVQIMADQTDHMKDLITDLLSLSRIELGEHQAPTTRVDFLAVAQETIEALKQVASTKNQTLLFETDVSLLPVIAAEGELRQVVHNLVGNAMKYAAAGTEISISIGLTRDLETAEALASRSWPEAARATLLGAAATIGDAAGGAAWLRVKDQGPGIDAVFLPRLGERFFRVDESRGGPEEGTGLGLAIVKHIMAHHRGGFAVESLPGEGAAFSVWLPALAERA